MFHNILNISYHSNTMQETFLKIIIIIVVVLWLLYGLINKVISYCSMILTQVNLHGQRVNLFTRSTRLHILVLSFRKDSPTLTSCRIQNTQLVWDNWQIEIVHVAVCLVVHMNLLFIIKVKILELSKWSYRPPPPNHVDYWT